MVAAQWIEVRRGYVVRPDYIGDGIRIVEECEDVGVRQHAAQRLHHFFATPHAEQPVVDDGGAHDDLCSIA